MKHKRADVQKLATRLRKNAGTRTLAEIAAAAKVHPSRVTRFFKGDFTRMTHTLQRLCSTLKVPVNDFLLEGQPTNLPPRILISLQKIIGRNPTRAAAAKRLIKSLEILAA